MEQVSSRAKCTENGDPCLSSGVGWSRNGLCLNGNCDDGKKQGAEMDNGDMTGHDWSRRGKKYNFQFSPPYLNNGPLDQDLEVQLLSFT